SRVGCLLGVASDLAELLLQGRIIALESQPVNLKCGPRSVGIGEFLLALFEDCHRIAAPKGAAGSREARQELLLMAKVRRADDLFDEAVQLTGARFVLDELCDAAVQLSVALFAREEVFDAAVQPSVARFAHEDLCDAAAAGPGLVC